MTYPFGIKWSMESADIQALTKDEYMTFVDDVYEEELVRIEEEGHPYIEFSRQQYKFYHNKWQNRMGKNAIKMYRLWQLAQQPKKRTIGTQTDKGHKMFINKTKVVVYALGDP
tara:strand:- start:168 stop:506 length:339 start_codon:yes stop_codon:yes gene_type:complete